MVASQVDDLKDMDIQRQRIELGLKQSDLGKRIGVSQATISTWENGKSQPDEVQLNALQSVFDGEPDGLATNHSTGWGEYPLDSGFVRTDQRNVGDVVKRLLTEAVVR